MIRVPIQLNTYDLSVFTFFSLRILDALFLCAKMCVIYYLHIE